jgi:type IV pilus assembly protein PilN
MIRINLLATERERVRRKPATLQLAQKVTLACSLVLVATAVGVGWWWWALSQRSATVDASLAAATRETARLKTLITEVETFDKQKQQLTERVSLIEQLRKGQGGPVRMIDEISRAMPDMLWLTELKQESNGDLTIQGRCASLTSLSDFVGNLERSGYFKPPVEIIDSQVESGAPGASELIKFSVKAQFALPGAAAPAAAVVPARAAR